MPVMCFARQGAAQADTIVNGNFLLKYQLRVKRNSKFPQGALITLETLLYNAVFPKEGEANAMTRWPFSSRWRVAR